MRVLLRRLCVGLYPSSQMYSSFVLFMTVLLPRPLDRSERADARQSEKNRND